MTSLEIIEFDMVDTPMEVVRSLMAPSALHKQRNVNGFQQRKGGDCCSPSWAVTAQCVPLDM